MNVQIVAANGAKDLSGHFRRIGNMQQPVEKTAEHAVGLIIHNLVYLRQVFPFNVKFDGMRIHTQHAKMKSLAVSSLRIFPQEECLNDFNGLCQ